MVCMCVCVCAADIISTVEFDHTGDYLATGDKGGRVVIFERSNEKIAASASSKRKSDRHVQAEYGFYAEFQSHEPEFDYLKSLEIEEKINKVKWLKRSNSSHLLLSTSTCMHERASEQAPTSEASGALARVERE